MKFEMGNSAPCLRLKWKHIIGFLSVGGFVLFLHSHQGTLLPGMSSPKSPIAANRVPSAGSTVETNVPSLVLERNLWIPQPPPEGLLAQFSWTRKLSGNGTSVLSMPVVPRVKQILFLDDIVDVWEVEKSQGRCPGLIGPRCQYSKINHTRNTRTLESVDAVITAYDTGHSQTRFIIPENTVHIFYFSESNYHSRATLRRQNDLLASFKRISDISMPYAAWMEYGDTGIISESNTPKNYAEGKSKMAAIVVSNCESVNRRLTIVKKLQEFIPVDIYGSCGSIPCPRRDSNNNNNCVTKLSKEYKFYLAFENSNCREYITEKLFQNAYMNDMLPVVLGAHPDDYKAVAPPHSYIHVEDFESVEKLAVYLKALDADDGAYNAYFRWKDSGQFLMNPENQFLCVMCAMLWYKDIVPLPPRPRPLVWNDTMGYCLPRGKWKWNMES